MQIKSRLQMSRLCQPPSPVISFSSFFSSSERFVALSLGLMRYRPARTSVSLCLRYPIRSAISAGLGLWKIFNMFINNSFWVCLTLFSLYFLSNKKPTGEGRACLSFLATVGPAKLAFFVEDCTCLGDSHVVANVAIPVSRDPTESVDPIVPVLWTEKPLIIPNSRFIHGFED